MKNPFSLSEKTVFVTGASSGLGIGIAAEISKFGAKTIITGRDEERLSNTFSMLQGPNNQKILADFCNVSDIDMLVESLPVLDGIVLCAGIIKTMPVKNITDKAINEIFQTNIVSSIQLLKRLTKAKKIARGASIVFISSVSTFHVKVGNSLYSASKGAVNSFAKAMALEVSKQKIRVNSIQPGFIPSQLLDKSGIDKNEVIQWYEERHPLGIGAPEDIAYACIYLLSDAGKWVTGSVFTIDGGFTLQ